jgi:hypothetical protein
MWLRIDLSIENEQRVSKKKKILVEEEECIRQW